MKQIGFTLMLVVVVLSPLAAVCQRSPRAEKKADWTAVQTLERGVALDVKRMDGVTVRCLFNGASTDALFCNPDWWSRRAGEFELRRGDVQQIRMARSPNRANNIVKTSTAVGTIAGFALPNQQGAERLIGAFAGGALGAMAGCVISLPAAFIPGKLIYRQAEGVKASRHAEFREHAPGAAVSGAELIESPNP